MVSTRFKAVLIPVVLLIITSTAFAQPGQTKIRQLLAVPDFAYDGPLWSEELGGVAADAFISRMRMDGNYVMLDRESVNKVLKQCGVEVAYDAPLVRAAYGYARMRANYAIVGRITSIQQIQEAPGKILVKMVIDVQIIDPYTPFIITSERIETEARRKEMIAEDAPWDKKEANKLLKSSITRLRQRLLSTFRTINRFNP